MVGKFDLFHYFLIFQHNVPFRTAIKPPVFKKLFLNDGKNCIS